MATDGLRKRLENMLASGQDSALLRFSLGSECLRAGDAVDAREHLVAAVAQNPDYSAAWKLLGQATAESGDPTEAVNVYQSGIEVATRQGDVQAAKEMQVFMKRLQKNMQAEPG